MARRRNRPRPTGHHWTLDFLGTKDVLATVWSCSRCGLRYATRAGTGRPFRHLVNHRGTCEESMVAQVHDL
jgi:hypothetical protein